MKEYERERENGLVEAKMVMVGRQAASWKTPSLFACRTTLSAISGAVLQAAPTDSDSGLFVHRCCAQGRFEMHESVMHVLSLGWAENKREKVPWSLGRADQLTGSRAVHTVADSALAP